MFDLYSVPWRLAPDNFTPPTRTPWGGRKIPDIYKLALQLSADKRAYTCVGESWEVSTDEKFQSRICGTGLTLGEAIARDPFAALGKEIATTHEGLPFLLKWLDASDVLSVQVHPSNFYANLQPKQCGKHEAWFVVAAEPGAAIYLGFRKGVTPELVRRVLASGDSLEELLNRVPVNAGDVFDIRVGTVHALGAGVTIIEPQEIIPGKEGVTYRVWDWNRTYDAAGAKDPRGKPRELHVEDALAVSSFVRLGEELVTSTRTREVHTSSLSAGFLNGTGVRKSPLRNCGSLTIIEGRAVIANETFSRGETAFCCAKLLETRLEIILEDATAVWVTA